MSHGSAAQTGVADVGKLPFVRSDHGRRSRKRGSWRIPAALLGVLIVVGAAVGVCQRLVFHPRLDALRPADAILVLGGLGYDRYVAGIELASAGWSPDLAISNPNGSNDAWLAEYCDRSHGRITVYCFNPDPSTTRGEGRNLRRLAAEHNWRSVIVVTYGPHISRARFILGRCFSGELIMVASKHELSSVDEVREILYQGAGFVRALLQPGC